LRHHLPEARNYEGSGYRKINWLKHVLSHGHTPGVRLLDIGGAQTWESLEKWHIAAHRAAGYDLVNETDGGEGAPGYVFSPEQRRAVSVRFKGKKKPPAHHAKLVAHLAKIAAERAAAPCCPQGHPLTPENLVPLKSGRRRCRICHNPRRREQTKRENERKGRTTLPPPHLRTHCPEGHEYTPENTIIGSKGERVCRLCQQQACRRSYEKRFGKTVDGPILPRPELRTQCPRGHEYTSENTYLNPRTGARSCKQCRRERNRQASRKGREAASNGS
jgi:hypothetical protein